ncbi:MAG: hypothetical protein K2X87_06720 [Gemmataceae bacterium]|nr:hypothetical protein [Gemmataceae bacterium]
MGANDQLVEQLANLDEADFVTVVEGARRQRVARRPPPPEPPRAFDRDAFARWYATRHLGTDPFIREVVYLPGETADNVIRLLEVNALSTAPDDAPVEPLDFGADRDLPGEHRLLVADITPAQWERVKAGRLRLPDGWDFTRNQIIGRKG